MQSFPSQSRVVNAILDGIKNAHLANLKWTNHSAWLSLAPEYMINIFIGQSIEKLSPMPEIWFEVSVTDLANSVSKSSNTKQFIDSISRNTKDGPKNEKIDIVLDDNKYSRVMIEVKNAVSTWGAGIEKDIERISKALKEETTLDYGIFAFFANDNKKKIDDIITDLAEQARQKSLVHNINLMPVFEIIEEQNNDWSCAAVCFVLERKKLQNEKHK